MKTEMGLLIILILIQMQMVYLIILKVNLQKDLYYQALQMLTEMVLMIHMKAHQEMEMVFRL